MGAMRPENQLLKYTARARIDSRAQQLIEQLLSQPFDWNYFCQAAMNHKVAALCYAHILAACPELVPGDQAEFMRAHAKAIAAANLYLAANLLGLLDRFASMDIQATCYKGPVLAEMAYGNLGSREFVDLDFILPHDHLPAACELLDGLGYRLANPALAGEDARIPGEYVFYSVDNALQVELHTELTLRHFPTRPNLEPLFGARVPVTVAGKGVLTFCPEDTLTLLAVHGAKDFWAQLLWICDVAWLVQTPGFNWDRALDRSEQMGCRRMTHVALLLASELLEAPMPREVLGVVQEDAKARVTARWLSERLFSAEAMKRWEQLRYRTRMVEGFWPGTRYAWRLATAPTTEDCQAISLPRNLDFFYRLIRPIRLLRARDKR